MTIISFFILAACQEWIRSLCIEERNLHFKCWKLHAKAKNFIMIELKLFHQKKTLVSWWRYFRVINDCLLSKVIVSEFGTFRKIVEVGWQVFRPYRPESIRIIFSFLVELLLMTLFRRLLVFCLRLYHKFIQRIVQNST